MTKPVANKFLPVVLPVQRKLLAEGTPLQDIASIGVVRLRGTQQPTVVRITVKVKFHIDRRDELYIVYADIAGFFNARLAPSDD